MAQADRFCNANRHCGQALHGGGIEAGLDTRTRPAAGQRHGRRARSARTPVFNHRRAGPRVGPAGLRV
jgi:hypothetical protein